MKILPVSLVILALSISAMSKAQWTLTDVYHSSSSPAEIWGVTETAEVGRIGDRPALWHGSMASTIFLGPPTNPFGRCNGTSAGQQVGYTVVDGIGRACLWSGTPESMVSLNPPGCPHSEATATNGTAQVGWAWLQDRYEAVMWFGTAASMISLHPPGAAFSQALAISANCQAGYVRFDGPDHAALWRGTANSFVDLHPAGAAYSRVYAVTDEYQGGRASWNAGEQAALWKGTPESCVNLQPPNCNGSAVTAIAGDYQVGWADNRSTYVGAALWSGTAESFIDLDKIAAPWYRYSIATSVWTDGTTIKIGGYAYYWLTGKNTAVIWTGPVPNENFELTLNKSAVAGENSVQGTITMSQLRPNTMTYYVYDDSSLVTTPGNITVAAGTLVRNFQITVKAINSTILTTIYARKGKVVRSQPLTLIPLVPTALAFTPSQVQGGQATSCRVVINGVAGPTGRLMSAFDNSAYAVTPSQVTVPPGATEVTFPISTMPVTSTKIVTVTIRVSAGQKTGTFRIVP